MGGRMPLLLSVLLCLAAGCRSSSELVEAELRTRNEELREARAALEHSRLHTLALEQEVHALRQNPAVPITPELASQTYTLQGISLSWLTGGYTDYACPAHEALQVVVEPRDRDGSIIKAPGTLHVDAVEITPEGLKLPLSSWDVSEQQLRCTWKDQLFGAGYFVLLPWKARPSSPRLRVTARLSLADGRTYEADRDVSLLPVQAAAPPAPAGEAPLPMPRPLEPTPTIESSGGTPAPGTGELLTPTSYTRQRRLGEAVQVLRPVPGR